MAWHQVRVTSMLKLWNGIKVGFCFKTEIWIHYYWNRTWIQKEKAYETKKTNKKNPIRIWPHTLEDPKPGSENVLPVQYVIALLKTGWTELNETFAVVQDIFLRFNLHHKWNQMVSKSDVRSSYDLDLIIYFKISHLLSVNKHLHR